MGSSEDEHPNHMQPFVSDNHTYSAIPTPPSQMTQPSFASSVSEEDSAVLSVSEEGEGRVGNHDSQDTNSVEKNENEEDSSVTKPGRCPGPLERTMTHDPFISRSHDFTRMDRNLWRAQASLAIHGSDSASEILHPAWYV